MASPPHGEQYVKDFVDVMSAKIAILRPVRLNLSVWLISHGTLFSLITKQHQSAYHPQKPSAEQLLSCGTYKFYL
jgi:hypothetical protein